MPTGEPSVFSSAVSACVGLIPPQRTLVAEVLDRGTLGSFSFPGSDTQKAGDQAHSARGPCACRNDPHHPRCLLLPDRWQALEVLHPDARRVQTRRRSGNRSHLRHSLPARHRRSRQELPALETAWPPHAGPLRAQESVFQPLDWRARPLVRPASQRQAGVFHFHATGFPSKYGMRLDLATLEAVQEYEKQRIEENPSKAGPNQTPKAGSALQEKAFKQTPSQKAGTFPSTSNSLCPLALCSKPLLGRRMRPSNSSKPEPLGNIPIYCYDKACIPPRRSPRKQNLFSCG